MIKSFLCLISVLPVLSIVLPSYGFSYLNDETAIKMIVKGKYNKKNKYIVHRIPEIITKKFELLSNQDFKTNIILNTPFNEKGVVKQLVVTQSKDPTADCHSCAPIVGISIFKQIKNNWSLENKINYVEKIGTWGTAPKPELIEIGKDNYGLAFESGYTGMGLVTSMMYIVGKVDKQYKVVHIQDNTYEDNSGICGTESRQPCYSYKAKLSLVKNNKLFYPITFTYTGNELNDRDKIVSANKTQKYIFSKEKYIISK